MILLTIIHFFRNGETVEYRSEPIARSDYHTKLDLHGDGAMHGGNTNDTEETQVEESKVRYWSDYSRVVFHPRSIQRLPDLPDWEDTEGDWASGLETFRKYDEVGWSSF